MIILKRSIQHLIDKAENRGYKRGIEAANAERDIQAQKIINKYELKIREMKSEIKLLESIKDNAVNLKTEAIEKDRLANIKMVDAREVVVRVQQVLNTITESVVRGSADIAQIREDIQRPVNRIMEK